MEESDLRAKILEAFTNPSDANTFEIVDETFLLSTKSGRNSKILVTTELRTTNDLHKVFLNSSFSQLLKAQDELQTSNQQISVLKEQLEILENEILNLTDEKERQENSVFKNFALLLNTKKQKIKDLRKELYPEEKGEFDESDEEPLKKRCSYDSDSEYEEPKSPQRKSSQPLESLTPDKPKRKSLQLLERGSDDDDSDNDFTAQTQVMDVLPKRVKLDDAGNRNINTQPGTSKGQQLSQTSQELLEML